MTSQTPSPMQTPPQHPTTDATGGVIPYKNVPALIGYYLAVFSLIPILALLLGPAAFILGIVGFRAYLKEPKKRGQFHAWVAIILGFITTCANLAFILILLKNGF